MSEAAPAPQAVSGDTFFRQLTSLSGNRLHINPFYSQEEFTYNQDPIVINHEVEDTVDLAGVTEAVSSEVSEGHREEPGAVYPELVKNEIEVEDDEEEVEAPSLWPGFSIRPRGERRIETQFRDRADHGIRETGQKSVDLDRILSERLSQSRGAGGEAIKLVNTIEYTATDYKGHASDHSSNSYRSGLVGGAASPHISHAMASDSLASRVDCGAGTEAGFCSMTSDYPTVLK